MPEVSAALLDELADRGWVAPETQQLGGWSLRFARGVTRRANSVLPGGTDADLAEVPILDLAIDAVEAAYAGRGLRPAFQLSPGSRPRRLAARLDQRGYSEEGQTLIMVASASRALQDVRADVLLPAASPATTSDTPSDEWFDTWWAVDSRGGDAERAVARSIMTAGPALYATVPDPYRAGAAAVGRLALVGNWGGLYCVATHADSRRRGHARAVVDALVRAGLEHGVENVWLQVLASNRPAIRLYESLGFETVSGYSYWIAPLNDLTAPV